MRLRVRRPGAATRRQLAFGGTLGAAAVLALALVLLVNWLGFRHYHRFDWTRSRMYTLSSKTLAVVHGLRRDVEVTVLMDEQAPLFDATREILARYGAASPRLHVRFVDPARNPALAQQLVQRTQMHALGVVFESGNARRVVDATDLADYDYAGMEEQGGQPQMKGFKGEQKFTGALVELEDARKPRILFTTGHGEPSLDSMEGRGFGALQQFLAGDNIGLEEWASMGKGAVPPGTDAVVVASAAGWNQQELAALGSFLGGGGRVLVLADPSLTAADRLAASAMERWLQGFGVTLDEDVVVDPSNLLPFFGAETIFASNYGTHPITDALRQARKPVVFSLARSARAAAKAGATVTELVKTSPDGWGETDLEHLAGVKKDPSDVPGPVSLGVAVELPPPPGKANAPRGRLVVYGDSDFATNAQLEQPGNATLIENTLNWMVQRETHLGIAPKAPEQVHLAMTPQDLRWNLWIVVIGIPAAALIAAVFVWLRRRR